MDNIRLWQAPPAKRDAPPPPIWIAGDHTRQCTNMADPAKYMFHPRFSHFQRTSFVGASPDCAIILSQKAIAIDL